MKNRIISILAVFPLIVSLVMNTFASNPQYAEPFNLPELTGDMRQDYINVAHSQLGYKESSDGATAFGAWADDPYQHWCSEFAAWCAEKAEIPTSIIPKKKSCAGYRKFFALQDLYFYVAEGVDPSVSDFTKDYPGIETLSINDVTMGDIILQESDGDYSNGPDHTAIFLENTTEGVKTISGNSSDQVKIKIIAAKDIHGICKPAFGQTAKSTEEKASADRLYALGLISGTGTDANGNPIYDLDRAPTRSEAITVLVKLLGKADEAGKGGWVTPFIDVPIWAQNFVGYAYSNGLTAGTSATTFGGNDLVSASQYITFVLKALGYSANGDFQWDNAWDLSDRLGITDGRYNSDTKTFSRGDVFLISEAALDVKIKGTEQTLAEKLIAAGTFTAAQYQNS